MWHKIKNKNELFQTVASLEGVNLEEWTVVHSFEDELNEFEDVSDEGEIFIDNKRKADTLAGQDHIISARLLKLIEAIVLTQSTSLLAEEAKLRSISIEDMARLVLQQNQELIDKELGRISTKVGDK